MEITKMNYEPIVYNNDRLTFRENEIVTLNGGYRIRELVEEAK